MIHETAMGVPASTVSGIGVGVLVCIGDDRLTATVDRPLVFGRADVRAHRAPGRDAAAGLDDLAPDSASPGTDSSNPGADPNDPGTDLNNLWTDSSNPGADPNDPGTDLNNLWTDLETGGADDRPALGPLSVIGLDAQDMGISGRSLAVEFDQGVWWLTNLSAKRNLLLDLGYGSAMITLRPGQRHAIAASPLGVLVPGAIFTHRLDVYVPDDLLALRRPSDLGASGTITTDDLHLTESDRQALAAVFSPLLRAWPRRGAHPLSYQEASVLLGPGWTGTAVRKHLERVRRRLADSGTVFNGSHAKDDVGLYLIDNGVLTAADLSVVDRGG